MNDMDKMLMDHMRSATPEELLREMYRNPVSGLYNRRAFELRGIPSTLAIIDVDGLKWINDTHGHEAGDDLLGCTGTLLASHLGSEAVFHLSGDEFVITNKVLFDNTKPQIYETVGEKELAERLEIIQDVIYTRFPITIAGHKYPISFSFGVGPTLAEADAALQVDKSFRLARGYRAERGQMPPCHELAIDGTV